MTDKPKTKAELEKALLRANNTIAKLRKQLERAQQRIEGLVTPPNPNDCGDVVTVMVGPLDDAAQPRMPWDDALPNGFAEGGKS